MPRGQWPLVNGRPAIEVVLSQTHGLPLTDRSLLADTGAGTARSGFEIVLTEQDCLSCGAIPLYAVALGGAYSGVFPVYLVRVRIPIIGFERAVPAVGVQKVPTGFDGIACFRFLNRFAYGNFGDAHHFGIEI